jgi:TonB family protein
VQNEAPLTRSVAEPAPPANAQPSERPANSTAPAPAGNAGPANGDRVLLAALGKSAPAQSPSVGPPLRVANRTLPSFPHDAARDGIRSGRVVARLTIQADGRVSATQIISATPMGYFERDSRRALATWRYEPPGEVTSAEVELVFNLE